MRVTFDTNTLDPACRPEMSGKNLDQHLFMKVHAALRDGRIQGAFSETLLTIEGVKKTDRISVFGGTKLTKVAEREIRTCKEDFSKEVQDWLGDAEEGEGIEITLQPRQPARQPLPPAMSDRVRAAIAAGLKVLRAPPRLAFPKLEGEDEKLYLPYGTDGTLNAWIGKAHEVGGAIEARGVGYAVVKGIGTGLAEGDEPWYRALLRATDIHKVRAIERAFGEWADGDSIASHIAYGMDVFCTGDKGKSAGGVSVLNQANHAWLTQTYGVHFMTVEELANSLP